MSDSSSDGAPVARPRRPRISGKFAAIWLTVGLLMAALLVPMALHLPLWIEAEIVLAIWWGVWLIVLTRLLYSGSLVTDDHRWSPPRNWIGTDKASAFDGWGNGCLWVPLEVEGCQIILALIVFIFAAWFLIEIAVPGLMILIYVIVRGMLAHVANDTHHCRGHLGRSAGWALVWATMYTAPYAGSVWLIHWFHGRP